MTDSIAPVNAPTPTRERVAGSKGGALATRTSRVTSPAPRDVWEGLLKADPHALVSQTPEWTDALCAAGGYADASRLYELPSGRRLILPLVRHRRVPRALASLSSLPYGWGIGGLVAPGGTQPADMAAVWADLVQQRWLRLSVRPNPLAAEAWATTAPAQAIAVPRLAHVLDLEGGFERVWTERFRSSTRRNVRKAERAGLVVECDTTGRLVPVFYDLFRQSLERWAQQQHEPLLLARWRGLHRDPMRKFHLLAERMGDSCRVWVAWYQGRAAATILVLQGKNAHYTRGAMDKEVAGPTRANDLLHRLAIEEACRAGSRYYHMGESGTSASLARFKEGFGAEPYPYAEYHMERLPITRTDAQLRGVIKRLIGFKDV